MVWNRKTLCQRDASRPGAVASNQLVAVNNSGMIAVMIPKRRTLNCLGLAGALAILLSSSGVMAAEHSGATQFHKDIQPILAQYCYDCHADGVNKGNVAFDEFKSDAAAV